MARTRSSAPLELLVLATARRLVRMSRSRGSTRSDPYTFCGAAAGAGLAATLGVGTRAVGFEAATGEESLVLAGVFGAETGAALGDGFSVALATTVLVAAVPGPGLTV
jgi:hypothetical protein